MEYKCDKCVKYYKTYQTLWKHNKEFHKNNSHKKDISSHNLAISSHNTNHNTTTSSHNVVIYNNNHDSLICKICNKNFQNRSNRWRHEKKCIINNDNKIKKQEEETKIKEQEENNKIKQLEEIINELKKQVSSILEEKGKIHHKTLQKINNQINNNGNINNGQIINNTYVKFGDVDYQRILDNKQVKHILNQQFMSLEESIKLVHFNKDLPEYNNVFITNMRDDIGYIFNGKEFISIKKNEMLNELIDTHVKEINLSLEKHKNKLNEKYVNRLEKFLDMLNDDDTKFTDQNNQRTYPSYKAYKINSLKLLIYNSSDKKKLDELNNVELHEKTYEIEESEE
jgi:hypothetical protein